MQSFSRTPLSFWCLIPSSQWQCINRSEEGRCLEKRLNDWELSSNVLNITFYKFLQLQRFIYFCDLSPSFQKCKDENTIFKTIFTKLLTPIAKQHEQVKMILCSKLHNGPHFHIGTKEINTLLVSYSFSHLILSCVDVILQWCVSLLNIINYSLISWYYLMDAGESGFFVFLHWV